MTGSGTCVTATAHAGTRDGQTKASAIVETTNGHSKNEQTRWYRQRSDDRDRDRRDRTRAEGKCDESQREHLRPRDRERYLERECELRDWSSDPLDREWAQQCPSQESRPREGVRGAVSGRLSKLVRAWQTITSGKDRRGYQGRVSEHKLLLWARGSRYSTPGREEAAESLTPTKAEPPPPRTAGGGRGDSTRGTPRTATPLWRRGGGWTRGRRRASGCRRSRGRGRKDQRRSGKGRAWRVVPTVPTIRAWWKTASHCAPDHSNTWCTSHETDNKRLYTSHMLGVGPKYMNDINAPQHLCKVAVRDTLAKLKENKNGKHLSKSSIVRPWKKPETSTDEKHKEMQK